MLVRPESRAIPEIPPARYGHSSHPSDKTPFPRPATEVKRTDRLALIESDIPALKELFMAAP